MAISRVTPGNPSRNSSSVSPPSSESNNACQRDAGSPKDGCVSKDLWISDDNRASRFHPPVVRMEEDINSALLTLACRRPKVFSFANALGHLAHFSCAWRNSSVARSSPHKETPGHATGQFHGAAYALRLDHRLSVVRSRGGGLACAGARIHSLSVRVDVPRAKQDSSCLLCRRYNHCRSSVAQSAPCGKASYRNSGLPSNGSCHGLRLSCFPIWRSRLPPDFARSFSTAGSPWPSFCVLDCRLGQPF